MNKPQTKLFIISQLIFLLLIASPLYAANEKDLFSLSLIELMNIEVSVTSKYKEHVDDSPANIHVFNRKQIQQRGYRNLEDLLQDLPGVHLQKFAILSYQNVISFRGAMGNNKFLILQDGVRLSSPAGEATVIGNNYPLYYAKQVEVLMGPASVTYGADAFMGVINIVTQNNDDEDNGEIALTTGTDGYGYGYAQWHKNFNKQSNLNMGLQAMNSQELKFAEDFPELYFDPANPGKTYQFSDTKEFQFFLTYTLNSNWQFGINRSTHSNSVDLTNKPTFSSFDIGATEKIHQTTLYGKFVTNINSNTKSSTLLTLMNYEMDNSSYFNNRFSSFEPGYKYANSNRVSLNQDFEFKLNEQHLLSSGLVYDYFDTIPKGADLPLPYNTSVDPADQAQFYKNTTLAIQYFEDQYYNLGGYVQDNWKINEQWRLVSGIRYDNNSLYEDTTNPQISLIHNYDENNLFKVLYGQAYLAPSPDQIASHFGSFRISGIPNGSGEWVSTPAPFRVPNPDLKPEQVKTLEFNYEHWFNKDNHLKVASFLNRTSDVIVRKNHTVPVQAIPGADLQNTFTFDNAGSSEIYGVDISIDNQISAGKWHFENWGYYSFTDGDLTDNGKKVELPMISHHKLSAGSTITYYNKYVLTPKLHWINTTQSNQLDPTDNTKRSTVPSYFVMDLLSEIQVTNEYSVKLNIYNLFDKKYVNAPFAPTFIAFNQAPQTGRLTTVTLQFTF